MFSLWKEVAKSMEGVEKVSEDFVTFWLIFLYYLNTIYHVYVLPKSRKGEFTHCRLGNKEQVDQSGTNPPGIL